MRNLIILTCVLCCTFFSCDKFGNNNYTVSGKVQKGPFSKGSDVTLYELEDDLQQTGKSFLTTISADDGSYEFKNIGIAGDLVIIDAEGYYFSEIYGEMSPAQISLHALADLSDEQATNVNVMTHVIKERIQNLVDDGKTYHEAKKQAESEFLVFLGVTESIDGKFESFDISHNLDENALLLSFSIMIQRFTYNTSDKEKSPAELSALLTSISSDFGDDGSIEQSIIDTLLHNISAIEFDGVRNNIESRYEELGVSTTIPDFEKYLVIFQKKYSEKIYTSIYYPELASPHPLIEPEILISNFLFPELTTYHTDPYSLAAIIPFGTTLTIKFNINPGSSEYPFGFDNFYNNGWEIENNSPNGIVFHSQKNNVLISMLFDLEDWGSATLEYYVNDSDTPTLSKNISWGVPDI